jgi:serine/threonine protein kinase
METTVDSRGGFPPGDEITRDYNILRLLGKGGMGEVYLAEQIRVGRRRVALKLIRPPYSNDSAVVQRFENEAGAAGRLDHENIVKIYDCRSTVDGRVYVAMEYVEGATLKTYMSEHGPLPLPTVVEIIGQACSGLEAAHRAGVVHRDIKPDNIMLAQRENGVAVKILDFGIARLADLDNALTSSGVVMGSAAYMSPEQADGMTGDNIDARADVYSLAMVAYEMLTGVAPFKSASWTEAVHRQKYETPPVPSSHRRDLPKEIDLVLLKALSKDRAQRQQSITEFADELRAACGHAASPQPLRGDVRGPSAVPVVTPALVVGGASHQNEGGAAVRGAATSARLPLYSRVWRRWAMLPRVLRWILIIILIPLILTIIGNLITLRHGENIIEWISRHFPPWGSSTPTNTRVTGPTPQPTSGTTPQPLPVVKLAEYRAMLETPTAKLDTLPDDNEIRAGEAVHFLVRLAHPGSVYLMHEREDGFLEWVNKEPQYGRAGEWLQIPQNKEQVIAVDDKPGAEKFLLIYVPNGSAWTLEDALRPQSVIGGDGFPTIPRGAAAKLMDSIRSAGVEMDSTTERIERAVTHKLVAADVKDKPAFHEFELTHTR